MCVVNGSQLLRNGHDTLIHSHNRWFSIVGEMVIKY